MIGLAPGAPTISVVVPAYNSEQTLRETIEAVRRQTFTDLELIVIDDGSTDGTRRYLETIQDPRLRVYAYPNGGLASARNRGIERSLGEFVSFIDADDLWTPDKLELQLQALRRHPEAAVAYSWTAFIGRSGGFLFAKDPSRIDGDVYSDLLTGNFVASGSNILVRKRCADAVGGFDTTLGSAHDWDFCLRVAARWPFVLVPKYQILYRIWEGAMSADAQRCEAACLRACERALCGLAGFPPWRRNQVLSNVKQYAAFLYLSRAGGVNIRREAGRKLAECIRLYPRTLLTHKTQKLLVAWSLLWLLPSGMSRSAITAFLRCYGRWLVLRRPEVRELVKALNPVPIAPLQRSTRLREAASSQTGRE